MISNLFPERGVPDALSETLQHEAVTDCEARTGRVLRVHRDWLNGGFHQVFFNLHAIEEHPRDYVSAYREVGLRTVAKLVDEALVAWLSSAPEIDPIWDDLDDRYGRLTYGMNGEEPDAIEAAIVRFIQQHPQDFENALRLAGE
jgi:hypothetical protein